MARRGSPAENAEAVLRVRAAVGPAVTLRADANRRWSLEQALQFGHAVKGAALQVRLHVVHLDPRSSTSESSMPCTNPNKELSGRGMRMRQFMWKDDLRQVAQWMKFSLGRVYAGLGTVDI